VSFRPFPAYRESGVDWITQIPEHWSVSPIRALSRSGESTFTDGDWIEAPFITDDGIRLLQTGNIGVGVFKEQGFRFISEETFEALRCTEVFPGDILICRLAEPVGRACIAPDLGARMITSVDVCILKPRQDIYASYIVHLLSSPQYLGFMEGQCRGGTRDRVSRSFLGSVRIPLPPSADQIAIARFLDRECGRIDALVAEQERLIALLREKRDAVISRAVTVGVDPGASLTGAAAPWFGRVPADWKIVPLRRLIQPDRKITYGIVQPGAPAEGGRYMVRGQDYSTGWADPESIFTVSDEVEAPYSRARLAAGDIVMTIVGAGVGNIAVVPDWLDGANITQTTARIAIDPQKALPAFVTAVLQGPVGRRSVETYSKGAAQPGLNLEHVKLFPIPLPPTSEQRQIVDYHLPRDKGLRHSCRRG
jgi:type I restriction enzyme S subunit